MEGLVELVQACRLDKKDALRFDMGSSDKPKVHDLGG